MAKDNHIGIVYVLSNRAMPGLVKIGMTTHPTIINDFIIFIFLPLKSLQCRSIEGFTIFFCPSQAYRTINERLLQRNLYLEALVNVVYIVGSLGKRVKSFGNDEIVLRPVLNHVSLRPVLP